MPRPRSLTSPQIAVAALAVIDRDSLAGLSMRVVAEELGLSTMALYRYVTGKEELENLVVDQVLTAVDLRLDAMMPWPQQITTLMERSRETVAAHPETVQLLLTRRHTSEASLHWGEGILKVLTQAGFSGQDRVMAFRTLINFLLGAIQSEHFGSLTGPGTKAMAELPVADFPHIRANARLARKLTATEEFRSGLKIVLDGLERLQES